MTVAEQVIGVQAAAGGEGSSQPTHLGPQPQHNSGNPPYQRAGQASGAPRSPRVRAQDTPGGRPPPSQLARGSHWPECDQQMIHATEPTRTRCPKAHHSFLNTKTNHLFSEEKSNINDIQYPSILGHFPPPLDSDTTTLSG